MILVLALIWSFIGGTGGGRPHSDEDGVINAD